MPNQQQITADKLKAIRSKFQYTQEMMADVIGVNVRTYQRIETGQSDLSLTRAEQIKAHFGTMLEVDNGISLPEMYRRITLLEEQFSALQEQFSNLQRTS